MKRGFTLIEIAITVVVIGILATITMASYKQFVDLSRQKVCQTNLLVLKTAVESYAVRHDAFPATVGDLGPQDVLNAYAKVMDKNSWLTKFSYFVVRLNTPKNAYAQISTMRDLVDPLIMESRGIRPKIFECPSDNTSEGISYGINANLIGRRWSNITDNVVVVADANSYTFTNKQDERGVDFRHIKKFGTEKIAQLAIRRGKVEQATLQQIDTATGPQILLLESSKDDDGDHYKNTTYYPAKDATTTQGSGK
jgi:prepilin-type N-terminal cleavage/methylation domain-containing protein